MANITTNPQPISSARSVPQNISVLDLILFEVLDIFASRTPGYSQAQIHPPSHYYEPIYHPPGEPSGLSRRAGDASKEVQLQAMEAIITHGKIFGMTDDEIALTLAIARHESGFNPDAGSNWSATGLGQFIDRTGRIYGLHRGNRWNLDAQAKALILHTRDNLSTARRRGFSEQQVQRYTYKYHHDGPDNAGEGLAIADQFVIPKIQIYKEYLKRRRSLLHD